MHFPINVCFPKLFWKSASTLLMSLVNYFKTIVSLNLRYLHKHLQKKKRTNMANIKLQLVIYISLLFSISSFSQLSQTSGPMGGRTEEIFKVDSNLILFTEWGGVYKSIDNGESWNPSNSGFPNNPWILDSFENDGTLYASIAKSGIYSSTNQGDSWVSISSLQDEETASDIFVDGNDIYGGLDSGGISYSSDNGVTWEFKTMNAPTFQITQLHVHNSKLYSKQGNGLFVSENKGDTWQEIIIPGISSSGVSSITTHNAMLFISDANNVFFSEDELTWMNSSAPSLGGRTQLQSNGDTLYLGANQGEYYYLSTIGGIWTQVQNLSASGFVHRLLFLENNIIMATTDGVYKTMDDGVTWSAINTGIKAESTYAMAGNSNYVFASAGYEIYRTDNSGQNWEPVDNGFQGPFSQNYEASSMLTISETLFVSTAKGIYSSIDNGDSWVPKFQPSSNFVGPLDYDNGILVTTEFTTGVVLSDDLGETWTLTTTEGLNTASQFISTLIKGNLIVVGTYQGEIFRSTDLGQSWSDISIPGQFDNQRPIDLEYQNDKLYVTSREGLWVSDDLGIQWQPFIADDTQYMDDVLVVDDAVYVATPNGVQVSSEGRNSWYPLTEGIGQKRSTKLFLHNDVIFVGTHAHSIWSGPLSELGVPPPDDDNDGIANVDDVCPNTTAGILVNSSGCDQIASNAILVYGETPTCPKEENGNIEITTTLIGYSFNITIAGEGLNESFENVSLEPNFNLESLAPGAYEVTVSIPTVQHEQVFGITVNELDSISGKFQGADLDARSAKFIVSGSTSYTVDINGLQKRFSFTSNGENEITLNNLEASNSITISGENDCQGKFVDSFSLAHEMQIYPTITSGLVSVLGGLEMTEIHIYDISGQLIEKIHSRTDKAIHLDTYVSGLYIVRIKSEEKTKIFKVIKK